MENNNLSTKVKRATKWSAAAELLAKLVNPISSLILARLLTPEAFGIVATIAMVISFAEIFTDAGFQKYLVQHEFKDEKDKEESTTVAFWSNLVMSLLIWGIIALFDEHIATLVGNPGLGYVLTIACVAIPLAAFSSIQSALYKRALDFKTLFKVRMLGIAVPILVTIPLAYALRSFWALVIANIVLQVATAIVLTMYSEWKPRFFYSFDKLKEMLSFTIWTVIETISIWLTCYVDIFIIGKEMNQYYLGLYKTGSTVTGQILGIVTATTTPILFSSLSRLQSDNSAFENLYLKFEKLAGLLLIPMGVGIYCYSDFITSILLGEQWFEASGFIGLWGVTTAFAILFAQYPSEVFRAKGKPKLSVLGQWLHIIALVPVVYWGVKYGFEFLYTVRSAVRVEYMMVQMGILFFAFHMSIKKMLLNVTPSCIASIAMLAVSFLLKTISDSIVWTCLSIVLCAMVYLLIILLFKEERNIIMGQFVSKMFYKIRSKR